MTKTPMSFCEILKLRSSRYGLFSTLERFIITVMVSVIHSDDGSSPEEFHELFFIGPRIIEAKILCRGGVAVVKQQV